MNKWIDKYIDMVAPLPGPTVGRGCITYTSRFSSFKFWYSQKNNAKKKVSKTQNQNPVLHFHLLQAKLNTLCRNSDAHHQKHWKMQNIIRLWHYIASLHTTCTGRRFLRRKRAKNCTGQSSQEAHDFLELPKFHKAFGFRIWRIVGLRRSWTIPRFPRIKCTKPAQAQRFFWNFARGLLQSSKQS